MDWLAVSPRDPSVSNSKPPLCLPFKKHGFLGIGLRSSCWPTPFSLHIYFLNSLYQMTYWDNFCNLCSFLTLLVVVYQKWAITIIIAITGIQMRYMTPIPTKLQCFQLAEIWAKVQVTPIDTELLPWCVQTGFLTFTMLQDGCYLGQFHTWRNTSTCWKFHELVDRASAPTQDSHSVVAIIRSII